MSEATCNIVFLVCFSVILAIRIYFAPIAKLTPINSSVKQLRPFGLCAGEFTVPDDFDAPLPEDIISGFEGQ